MRPPKYRIFKTDNEDYVIKRRGCCLGWTEKSFDREKERKKRSKEKKEVNKKRKRERKVYFNEN